MEAATKQLLVKTENFMCTVVTVILVVCVSVRLSKLFVVTFCKCLVKPITNPNPVYSQSN
jgi:hypothetical protein